MDPINKIVNATAYEDGTNSYLGKVKEIELPKIVHAFVEHEALGLLMKLQLPTGTIEALEMKFTWSSYDKEAWKKSATPGLARKIAIKQSVMSHGAGGLLSQTQLLTQLTVQSKQADLGKLANGTASEAEEPFVVNYIKQTFGTEVLLEFDPWNSIWMVGGKDVIADFKKSLGL